MNTRFTVIASLVVAIVGAAGIMVESDAAVSAPAPTPIATWVPTTLKAASGLDSVVLGSASQMASEVGASGAVTGVATNDQFRFVRIASDTAAGRSCYGIRPGQNPSEYLEVQCPATPAAAEDVLHDESDWHSNGWLKPVVGFAGQGVDHIVVTVQNGDAFDVPIVNGAYAYGDGIDHAVTIDAVGADGTVLSSVHGPSF